MNIYEIMLLPLFAVVMLILPVVYILKKKKSNSAAKTAFVVNICSFFAVLALIFVALGEGVALYGFLISFMILNAL